jgi:hypothetical protein
MWFAIAIGSSLLLPREPCVRILTRLLMQGVSIEKHQANALTSGQIVFRVYLR